MDEQQFLLTRLWPLSELEDREQLAAVLEVVYTNGERSITSPSTCSKQMGRTSKHGRSSRTD
ncbi:hypothetical protein NJ7G_3859 [Natrinema sp. J7-2]|nr:hypothetical protein NJ7G_3859 [Natrinema sp. J7-2]